MGFLERILLLLYFPQFKSPECSRFESFFISIYKKEKKIKKKKKQSKLIFPERIIRNEDKRTSIMIKGIPTNMAKSEVRNLVDKYGNINYLYVITSSMYNYSIAFINLINYKSIIPLFMNLRNCRIEKSGLIYNLKIMYSIVQGKQELKKYMKSRKMFNF